MIEIAIQAGQKCTLNKPLYCPKNGEHLNYQLTKILAQEKPSFLFS